MRFRILALLPMLVAPCVAAAQSSPAMQRSNPASAPSPAGTSTPPGAVQPSKPNPAAAPSPVQSDAGATERGLAPVRPGNPGVTPQVEHAATHDVDAQGHTVDPHGKPVGQAPAVPATVH